MHSYNVRGYNGEEVILTRERRTWHKAGQWRNNWSNEASRVAGSIANEGSQLGAGEMSRGSG